VDLETALADGQGGAAAEAVRHGDILSVRSAGVEGVISAGADS
jgi:hypothetical protein